MQALRRTGTSSKTVSGGRVEIVGAGDGAVQLPGKTSRSVLSRSAGRSCRTPVRQHCHLSPALCASWAERRYRAGTLSGPRALPFQRCARRVSAPGIQAYCADAPRYLGVERLDRDRPTLLQAIIQYLADRADGTPVEVFLKMLRASMSRAWAASDTRWASAFPGWPGPGSHAAAVTHTGPGISS